MKDLTNPKWIVAKGFLFLALGLLSATLLIVAEPRPKFALLLAVTVWAFCRFYYFLFCVIERYVDPTYRFAGWWSFAFHLLRKRRRSSPPQP